MMHWQTHLQFSGSILLSGQLVRCRLKKKQLFHTYICKFFVFALKCATVKRSAIWHVWIYTASPMSLKVSSSIADRKIDGCLIVI